MTLPAAARRAAPKESNTMTIKVGDSLPEATFRIATADGPQPVTTAEVFGGKKVVLFAVPGAFTPTCHKNHLPGYLTHREAILAKGVQEIAVVSVNDIHVMKAWAEATGGAGKITFLSDGSAEFAKAVGLELDASAFGMGMRSKRFAMIVNDGKVEWMAVEDAPGKADLSGAEALIKHL
jgi:glutaredoxin/glutathione-dependent peroxiredoxin